MINLTTIRTMYYIKGEFCRWETNRDSTVALKVTAVSDGTGKDGTLEYQFPHRVHKTTVWALVHCLLLNKLTINVPSHVNCYHKTSEFGSPKMSEMLEISYTK